ncbi:Transmembrane protein 42 [Geodia barretti]|uniref:Transmembrane protein 42 n=1 Tax=Geodia barretti TaxID=519541 RepID=A0AA35WHI4_GEOBA|nr:Transmembrane protein 42 [Geodia barretti]
MARGVGFSLAVAAGFCAAMASVFSKLAFEEEGATLKHITCPFVAESVCPSVVLALRVGSFILLFLSNAVMWALFVRALQGCGSTVEAAVANSGSNFIFTALFGIFLFGESVSLMWWFGASLVVLGLVVIQHGVRDPESDKKL